MTCEELKKQFYDYVLKEETKNGGVLKEYKELEAVSSLFSNLRPFGWAPHDHESALKDLEQTFFQYKKACRGKQGRTKMHASFVDMYMALLACATFSYVHSPKKLKDITERAWVEGVKRLEKLWILWQIHAPTHDFCDTSYAEKIQFFRDLLDSLDA